MGKEISFHGADEKIKIGARRGAMARKMCIASHFRDRSTIETPRCSKCGNMRAVEKYRGETGAIARGAEACNDCKGEC